MLINTQDCGSIHQSILMVMISMVLITSRWSSNSGKCTLLFMLLLKYKFRKRRLFPLAMLEAMFLSRNQSLIVIDMGLSTCLPTMERKPLRSNNSSLRNSNSLSLSNNNSLSNSNILSNNNNLSNDNRSSSKVASQRSKAKHLSLAFLVMQFKSLMSRIVIRFTTITNQLVDQLTTTTTNYFAKNLLFLMLFTSLQRQSLRAHILDFFLLF